MRRYDFEKAYPLMQNGFKFKFNDTIVHMEDEDTLLEEVIVDRLHKIIKVTIMNTDDYRRCVEKYHNGVIVSIK